MANVFDEARRQAKLQDIAIQTGVYIGDPIPPTHPQELGRIALSTPCPPNTRCFDEAAAAQRPKFAPNAVMDQVALAMESLVAIRTATHPLIHAHHALHRISEIIRILDGT